MTRERKHRLERQLSVATLVGGLLVAIYWTVYFTNAVPVGQEDSLASAYEAAFPVADALLAILLFAASRALYAGRRTGSFFLVAAAAACLYLGFLDLTFYTRAGVYWPLTTAGAVELFVNACCIGGGAAALRLGWQLWGAT
ncbi:MAG: hypothetical protein HYT81_04580 [Gemmatimonadetes bacterium]|nr:hypothetical protein [Gemmatimonadota bacterium]MBI2403090.1 hypothetical protein [Gemmatimonadota bacterium]